MSHFLWDKQYFEQYYVLVYLILTTARGSGTALIPFSQRRKLGWTGAETFVWGHTVCLSLRNVVRSKQPPHLTVKTDDKKNKCKGVVSVTEKEKRGSV